MQLTSPNDGQTIEFWAVQDATGGRGLTFPANVLFQNGVAPTLSGIANGIDVFRMTYNTAQDLWISDAVLGASGGASIAAQLPSNEVNVRLFERLGSPAGAVTINVTVPAGVTISSQTPATAALDLTGFASGSTINLINNGLIHGAGGDGGNGGGIWDQGAGLGNGDYQNAGDGLAGGIAVLGPGSGITCNIYNANGRIWGGGGGGGGGGILLGGAGIANGGGGAGGAGGGRLGRGSRSGSGSFATDGSNGSTGRNGVGGTGGIGATSGGTGGNGGNGGTFGVAGDPGTSTAPGAAGAAGKAVEFNGGSASVISGAGAPNILGAVS